MPDTKNVQSITSANPQHNFLFESLFVVTGIETVRDRLVDRIILRDIGVKEIERDISDVNPPECNVDREIDDRYLYHELKAVFIQDPFDRRCVPVEDLNFIILPAIRANVLMKISSGVHKANRNQRQTEVAGLFQMVSGEKSKASRIKRKGVL